MTLRPVGLMRSPIITVGPSRWILTVFACEERYVVRFSAMLNLSGREARLIITIPGLHRNPYLGQNCSNMR